jgi:hypothetical protein
MLGCGGHNVPEAHYSKSEGDGECALRAGLCVE